MNFSVSGERPTTGKGGDRKPGSQVRTSESRDCCSHCHGKDGLKAAVWRDSPHHRMALCQTHAGSEAGRLVFQTSGVGKGSNRAMVIAITPEFAALENVLLCLSLQQACIDLIQSVIKWMKSALFL